jgi:hypothetical protein
MRTQRKKKTAPGTAREKTPAQLESENADRALAILRPILARVGLDANQAAALSMSTLSMSKIYLADCWSWRRAYEKQHPSPTRSKHTHDKVFDRESYRRESREWSEARKKWFSERISEIREELDRTCRANRWKLKLPTNETGFYVIL